MRSLVTKHRAGWGLFLFICIICSCNKQGTDSLISTPPAVWGKMSAILQHRKIISGSDTINYYEEIVQAEFVASPQTPGIFTDAGEVKINDSVLIKNSANVYHKSAPNLGLLSSLKWDIEGNGVVPILYFEDTVAYPQYNVQLPFEVNKATGISFSFDETTLTNADSVRVIIDDGGAHFLQKTFSAKAGAVMITPAELATLDAVSGMGGIIGIYPYKGTIKAKNSKGYYYIKERRLRQSVSIL